MALSGNSWTFTPDYGVFEDKKILQKGEFFLIIHRPQGEILGLFSPSREESTPQTELLSFSRESEPLMPLLLQGDICRIGRVNGKPCLLVSLEEETPAPPGYRWYLWRRFLGESGPEIYHAVSRGIVLAAWGGDHRYCGRCGAKTIPDPQEPALVCSVCTFRSYPRISPAVIVRITNGDSILLARNRRFPPDLFSCVAGYVDPGENLETAVRREVQEEVGLDLEGLSYFDSQSWPFPHSLMMGFLGEASGTPRPDGKEIVEARWFPRDALPRLSRKGSIARRMIDAWSRSFL